MATYKFYSIPFKRFTSAAHGDADYLRMRSMGKAFFTHKRALFKKDSLNNFAEENEIIYLATHELRDGSYWIHWLAKSNGDIILPNSATYSMKRSLYCILALSLLFVECFTMIYGLVHSYLPVYELCITVFLITCTLGISIYFIDSLIIALHPGNNKLKKVLNAVQQGDFSRFTNPEKTENTISQSSFLYVKSSTQLQMEGLVNSPQIEKWQTTYAHGKQYYAGASFLCDSKPLIISWSHKELNERRTLFIKWHPPFITQDDIITVVYSQAIQRNKYFRFIPCEGHQIAILKNITDGSVYLPAIGFKISLLGQLHTQRRCLLNATNI